MIMLWAARSAAWMAPTAYLRARTVSSWAPDPSKSIQKLGCQAAFNSFKTIPGSWPHVYDSPMKVFRSGPPQSPRFYNPIPNSDPQDLWTRPTYVQGNHVDRRKKMLSGRSLDGRYIDSARRNANLLEAIREARKMKQTFADASGRMPPTSTTTSPMQQTILAGKLHLHSPPSHIDPGSTTGTTFKAHYFVLQSLRTQGGVMGTLQWHV